MTNPETRLSFSMQEECAIWLKKVVPFWSTITPLLTEAHGLQYYEPIVRVFAPNLAKPECQQWIALNAQILTPVILTKMMHFVHLCMYERSNMTAHHAVHLYLLARAVNCPKMAETAIHDLVLAKAEVDDIMSAPKLIGDRSFIDVNEEIELLLKLVEQNKELENIRKSSREPQPKITLEKSWLNLFDQLEKARDSTGDLTVLVEDKPYKAHKFVLAYSCDFFAGCLLSQFKEADKGNFLFFKIIRNFNSLCWLEVST